MHSMMPKPQWIARTSNVSTGRDQLGLGSVSSNQALQLLSPGINVLTYHPRYYSFYAFLLDEFWSSERPRTRSEWVAFLRPRDYIFSVGVHLCDQEETHGHGLEKIVGSQKTEGKAKARLAQYDTTFNYIKSDESGYGLYYRTVMAEIGLLIPVGYHPHGPLDLPTPVGRELAEAFRKSVAHTEYYRKYFRHDKENVPFPVLQEYAREACLCRLKSPTTPDRALLLQQFLGGTWGEVAELKEAASYRRNTFRLFLDIAHQTAGYPISDMDFRQLIYFRHSHDGATYTPQDDLKPTFELWRMFQLREYYAFALNAMWYFLCQWGIANRGDVIPIHEETFLQEVLGELAFESLAQQLDVPAPALDNTSHFADLLTWIVETNSISFTNFDAECGLVSPINEHRLYSLAQQHIKSGLAPRADTLVSGMLMILALLILRFKKPEARDDVAWQRVSTMGADGRLSVEGFMRQMDWRFEQDATIEQIIRWLYREYIILQHQIVATGKLPEDTFRFQKEGAKLRFYRHENVVTFRDSRFEAISTTVHELGLCGDFRLQQHPLTEDGQYLLEIGEL